MTPAGHETQSQGPRFSSMRRPSSSSKNTVRFPFQDEKHLFNRMRVRRIAFARWHVHHRQPRRTGGNMSYLRLAERFADVAELGSTIAVVVRVSEDVPVRFNIGEADRVALRNPFEIHVNDSGMTRMPSDFTHIVPPVVTMVKLTEIFLDFSTMPKSVYPLYPNLANASSPTLSGTGFAVVLRYILHCTGYFSSATKLQIGRLEANALGRIEHRKNCRRHGESSLRRRQRRGQSPFARFGQRLRRSLSRSPQSHHACLG